MKWVFWVMVLLVVTLGCSRMESGGVAASFNTVTPGGLSDKSAAKVATSAATHAPSATPSTGGTAPIFPTFEPTAPPIRIPTDKQPSGPVSAAPIFPTFEPTAPPIRIPTDKQPSGPVSAAPAIPTATPITPVLPPLTEAERNFALCELTAAAILDQVWTQAYEVELDARLRACPTGTGDLASESYCRTQAESAAHDYAYDVTLEQAWQEALSCEALKP